MTQVPAQLPDGFDKLPLDVMHRVLDLVEAEQQHLHWRDKREQELASRGQWIALGLCIFFGLIALWTTLAGHDWVGGTIAGTTIVAVSGAFIAGRRRR